MIIRFSEPIRLPAAEIYSYFRSPADWVRLYGFAGEVRDRGDGWYAVPLKRFPFPLVAKVTAAEPFRLVRWVFKGFWAGGGEVRLVERPGAVLVEGHEAISPRWLPVVAPALERLFMEREFRRIWALGWRRLRRQERPDARTLTEILGACWSKETSPLWSAEAPSRGQCAVTALVLHDHFGGEILKTRVGTSWHFYNRLAGSRLDVTADQFPDPVAYLDLASTREEAFGDTDARQYAELSRRFASQARAFALGPTKERNG